MKSSDPRIRLAEQTIVVGSGKGGVGKSTVTLNLAVSLALAGKQVGVLDADLYGPSIPVMLGLRRLSPKVEIDATGKERAKPFTKFGIKALSLGFFVDEAAPVMWRGPVLHNALAKMIREVDWGKLDYLLIDLPPGTGDIQMSLSQLIEIDHALIVSTPQEVAMVDAVKAINSMEHLGIHLLGIIENMAGFRVPGSDTIHHIFGQGKGEELAFRFRTPLLGRIPLEPAIRIGGDEGLPCAFHRGNNEIGRSFHQIAIQILEKHNVASHADA
jgi:ATP-binding protein involved in chromosome partitioning